MSDAVVFETLMKDTERIDPFDASRWNFITDSNNSSYTNSVTFDCSSISTANGWTDWRSVEIEVPLTLQSKIVSTTSSAPPADSQKAIFALWASLKSGHYNLFDSINVLFDGRSVTQQITNQNFITNYNLLTTLSKDEEENLFDVLGMAKDTAESCEYVATGNGAVNNKAVYVPPTPANGLIDVQNKGLFNRLSTYNTASRLAKNQLDSEQLSRNTHRTVVSTPTYTGNTDITWELNMVATLRLRDFHDLFDKLEATKGSPLRITLNLNTVALMNAKFTIGTLLTTGWGATTVQLYGQSNPIMLADISANQCQATFGAATTAGDYYGRLVVGASAASGTFQATTGQMLNNCRLYYKSIVLDPNYEEMLLNKGRYKEIVYDDSYLFTLNLGESGTGFTSQVGSQIPYLKKVIIMPFLTASTNGNVGLQSFQAPFSSAPSTLDPLPQVITNFQANIGGKNMVQDTLQYGWQTFNQYFAPQQGLNGDYVNGLSSGLISKQDWESGLYGYYVIDVRSNSSESDFAQTKAIQLSGNVSVGITANSGPRRPNVMAYVFAIYERKIKIDLLTGKIVE